MTHTADPCPVFVGFMFNLQFKKNQLPNVATEHIIPDTGVVRHCDQSIRHRGVTRYGKQAYTFSGNFPRSFRLVFPCQKAVKTLKAVDATCSPQSRIEVAGINRLRHWVRSSAGIRVVLWRTIWCFLRNMDFPENTIS